MTNSTSAALFNQSLVRTHVCAQCWGALVEKVVEGEFRVVCPKNCQPGGFVTREYADRRKAASIAELEEVARNYPQLDPRPPATAEEMELLFGKE